MRHRKLKHENLGGLSSSAPVEKKKIPINNDTLYFHMWRSFINYSSSCDVPWLSELDPYVFTRNGKLTKRDRVNSCMGLSFRAFSKLSIRSIYRRDQIRSPFFLATSSCQRIKKLVLAFRRDVRIRLSRSLRNLQLLVFPPWNPAWNFRHVFSSPCAGLVNAD